MDRHGVRQVPEGSGEQGKMEKKLVVKSSVVPQRPSRLKDDDDDDDDDDVLSPLNGDVAGGARVAEAPVRIIPARGGQPWCRAE